MNVREVQGILEEWAHPSIAWDRDNVGLQVGDPSSGVKGILIALDATEAVVAEAQHLGDNHIVTHHPLLFKPPRSIRTDDATGRMIQNLLGAGISLLSAHTNLDFSRKGTSFALGEVLGLREMSFLHRPYKNQVKIVTFVPAQQVDVVAEAMATAGAGHIGNYDTCSFRTEGTGTFRGSKDSHPTVGTAGSLESVPEVRLEMVAPSMTLAKVIAALKNNHPYEEVAYDVYPTENPDPDHGMGIIGTLEKAVTLKEFIAQVKKALSLPVVRCCGSLSGEVRRVAACGGSGADLLPEAIRQGADVFVTADVKYHSFHDAEGMIALLDAGHFETEFPVVHTLAGRLTQEFHERGEKISVHTVSTSTNPIQYV